LNASLLHRTGVGIERNPRFWSDSYETFLAQNVVPGLLPARQSYLSVTELESRLGGSWNSYDQYEVRECVIVLGLDSCAVS
jgi:hypothetical protein